MYFLNNSKFQILKLISYSIVELSNEGINKQTIYRPTNEHYLLIRGTVEEYELNEHVCLVDIVSPTVEFRIISIAL